MKSYEATLETKNLSIDQVSASDQQIKQKQSQIDQANLRYQLAADTYSKTIVKAKSAGTISSFTLDKGDFVSTGVSTGSLKTSDDLELVTYVSPSEKAFISTLSQANVEDFQTTIKTISGSIDSKTKKTRITLEDPSELELLEGTQLGCTIARIQPTAVVVGGGIIVPLSAISVIGTQPHVFTLDQKNIAVAQPVDLGAILGNTIVTYGIVSDSIVSDARGITSGDLIEVKE
jgi:multidrug efflux pump subunit AcrA (membrane-fusion protein)